MGHIEEIGKASEDGDLWKLWYTAVPSPKSAQVIVPDANHYFTDKGDELVEPVAKWLNAL